MVDLQSHKEHQQQFAKRGKAVRSIGVLGTAPKPCGPIRTPAAMKPTQLGIRIRWVTEGMISTKNSALRTVSSEAD
jgi:hypothetical protein